MAIVGCRLLFFCKHFLKTWENNDDQEDEDDDLSDESSDDEDKDHTKVMKSIQDLDKAMKKNLPDVLKTKII